MREIQQPFEPDVPPLSSPPVDTRHSRPTAVNLADSAFKLKAVARTARDVQGSTPLSVVEAVVDAAEGFLEEDIAANRVGQMRGRI
jgi:methylthioribose-1-phosphate isomerase